MSINNANGEIPETPTHLYLLPMTSSLNLRTNEQQLLPLHILNSSADYNTDQFFLPLQKKDEEQNQLEILINTAQESAIKYVALQVDKDYQQICQIEHLNPASLKSEANKEIPITDIIAPSLVNTSAQDLDIEYKGPQRQNYVHISDRSVPPRAVAVLPSALQIRQKDSISPRRTLPPRTRFGPVKGVKHRISHPEAQELTLTAITNKIPLFMLRDEDDHFIHIDVSDKDKSNWIGLLPIGDKDTANVWIYEESHELYIITTEAVPSRKPLMLGYSKKYAEDYGLIGPTKDIEAETRLNRKPWWCYECQRAMISATQLQKHIDAHHQEDKPIVRRRYRCRYCTRTFSRIFTLRRHVARNCEKKNDKRDDNIVIITEPVPEPSLNSSLNSEENRVPSDESFQNYSNGLDFSTTLFDTDRMPSLDISGNSRSEVFNPYELDSASPLANDLGFTNGCSDKNEILPSSDNEKKLLEDKNEIPVAAPCPYCNHNVAKGKRRQHVSECPARRFECECKKIFPNKELLAQHIFTQHSNEKAEDKQYEENNTSSSDTPPNTAAYVCEQCQHTFKRRGMLVNHLWRVHNTVSARVPLERRVRHYPCVVCPKIYRTAAKRDLHVKIHHPGSEKIRPKPMDGGMRACSPAACTACPRQYATRAKMLQHHRSHHPHLALPPSNKTTAVQKSKKANECNTSEDLIKNKPNYQQLINFYLT